MNNDITQIVQVFQAMISDGFDVTKPLKWGFFFIAGNVQTLEDLYSQLLELGYVGESLNQDESSGEWILQVSKSCIFTPESLFETNNQLNLLANSDGVEIYDGWDVGPIVD